MTIGEMLRQYIDSASGRFHMPGHKGVLPPPLDKAALFDITEVAGADSLYASCGVIADCEARYAAVYGAGASLLSAGGATLCIQGMLGAFCRRGDLVVAGRNAHVSAIHAMGLLGLRPRWVYPALGDGQKGIAGLGLPLAAGAIQKAIEDAKGGGETVAAVYLTTPDYAGQLADVAAIKTVCRRYDVPLLVDNAHGAHLKFLKFSGADLHPMTQGADACADSLHKTLPVLTGGAVLHLKDAALKAQAKGAMALFGSTSPSYLIMLSAEMALDALESGAFEQAMGHLAATVADWKRQAESKEFALPAPGDPIRLTLGFGGLGHTRESFGVYLRQLGVEPEYVAGNFAVFLPGNHNTPKDLQRLGAVIANVVRGTLAAPAYLPVAAPPKAAVTLARALTEYERVLHPVDESIIGRIAGEAVTACPPGTALVIPGESIDAALYEQLKNDGIHNVFVLK